MTKDRSESEMQLKYFALVLLAAGTVSAKEIHVSPGKTVALRRAKAGDTVWFKGGRYAEPVEFQGLAGTADKPITLATAPGEKVVFDGTDELPDDWRLVTRDSSEGKLIQPAQWKRMQGKLYCLKLDEPIYALVYDGRLMSDARWPDARWGDPWRLDRYMVLRRASEESVKGELHDGLPTENTLEESSKWIHYDRSRLNQRKEMLGDTGISFQDAVVVMSHTWGSWGTRVTEHKAGSNRFKYDTKFSGSGSIQEQADGFLNHRLEWHKARQKLKRSSHGGIHFFLLGLAALDIEEEWWYDQPTQTLYFIAPDGKRPAEGMARGKRRGYQLTVRDSQHVHVRGLNFLGGAALLDDCENSRLEDCTFRFGSYHKFSVGNFDMPVTTRIANARGGNKEKLFGNALVNCQFTYLDGNAFEGRSRGLTIDNVLIYRTQQTTLGLDSRSMSIHEPLLVRRVTIDDVGASVGIKGGGIDSNYELNNITRFGGLQYDGAALQMGGRNRVIYRYNWSHDHPKRSYRFDAGSYPSFSNAFGEMSYNVAWNTPGGFAIKGDDHLLHNNVLLGDGTFELFNMKRWGGKNERTVVANNIVPRLEAGTDDWHLPAIRKSTQRLSPEEIAAQEKALAEAKARRKKSGFDDGTVGGNRPAPVLAVQRNNYMEDATAVLRDPANLDFRPKRDSKLIDAGCVLSNNDVSWKDVPFTGSDRTLGSGPDIGAYEYGDKVYWIPGFQFPHASTPIPPDGTKTAKADCDLMWLAGYKANRHDVYFGSSAPEIAKSTRPAKTLRGDANIFSPGPLVPGKTYFWRVDATRDGETTRGEIWSFTVQSSPQRQRQRREPRAGDTLSSH